MRSLPLLLLIAAPAASGCAHNAPDQVPGQDTTPPPVRVVTETVTVRDPEADQRLFDLQMQLAEKDQQVEELQQRLDEAQRDVVRSMAKVQTLATRAEAASGMAEAEVALETLKRTVGAQGPGVAQPAALLQQATDAFNHQNYGGALWLANQAKNRAVDSRGRLAGTDSLQRLDGERLFSVPVRFETLGRTNLRAGPGTNYDAITTLDGGTALTGVSYVPSWIRVMDGDGRIGWVYGRLVQRRSGTGG
jgi:uncharacterized coiled-coil protein SlyX